MLLLKHTAICVLLLSSITTFCQRKPGKPADAPGPVPVTHLLVDATHAPQKILHAQLQIPALPGNFTLVYPKWIPGEHGPTGPIVDLTGLQFFGNGPKNRVGIAFFQAEQNTHGPQIRPHLVKVLGCDLPGHDALFDAPVGESADHF